MKQRTKAPPTQPKRWLTVEARERSLDALKAMVHRKGGSWKLPPDPRACKRAGLTGDNIGWQRLYRRIEHATKPGCRFREEAISLAAYLLNVPKSELASITTETLPVDTGVDSNHATTMQVAGKPRQHDAPGDFARRNEVDGPVSQWNIDEVLEVSCPHTVYDHRVVIVGQLPNIGMPLFPAVFVGPRDGTDDWYPQCGIHNPLIAGRAFCCLAHFGNPNGIWHAMELPMTADVRVCALNSAWNFGSHRLSNVELQKKLDKIGVAFEVPREVRRLSQGVRAVNIADCKGRHLKFPGPHSMKCTAPLQINWRGNADGLIEIRVGDGDESILTKSVPPGFRLVLSKREVKGQDIFLEKGPGRYRIRLYPGKVTFVDPAYEWWLDIS